MADHAKLDIGTQLGERYELAEEIGEGGFGKIYRARQLNIDRTVAIKILPPKFAAREKVVQRFRREARLASQLRHPHTITIHDYGRQDDLLFIAMEYLEGQDLADRLSKQSTLTLERARHIGLQTLESLREAHKLGIVHRDLKPENIFLTSVGDDPNFVKVLDFGIAKLATQGPRSVDLEDDEGRSLTVQGNTVGTPAYMSPEQAAAEDIGPSSDLYTVGLILFEMVNGHAPFSEERPARTMRAHLFDPVPTFSNDELRNSRFESMVRKALAKEPDERFTTAEEFIDALSSPDLKERSLGSVTLGTTGGRQHSQADAETPIDTRSTPGESDSVRVETPPETEDIPFDALPDKENEPPPGFAADDQPAGSSIITVVDEPDEDDVIVLTEKKRDEATDDKPEQPKPDTDTDQSQPSPDESTAPVTDADDWSWGGPQKVNGADASGSQILTNFEPGRRRRRLLVGMSLIVAGLLLFFAIAIASGWLSVL